MSVPALAEPISPELALVCPELARRARELLPDRDPNGFVPQRRAAEAPPRSSLGPTTWLAASLYVMISTLRVAVNGVAIAAAIVMALTLVAGWTR